MQYLINLPPKKISKSVGKTHPKSQFSKDEDQKLISLVKKFGENNWYTIAECMGNRNERQCRERWRKYLDPAISKEPWTPEEDELLINLYKSIPGKWMKMSKFFYQRTDASLKNRWSVLKRRFFSGKIKPQKHKKDVNNSPIDKITSETVAFDPNLIFDTFQDDSLDNFSFS